MKMTFIFFKKIILAIVLILIALPESISAAHEPISLNLLELEVLGLTRKENNLFEFYIDRKLVTFENQTKNDINRPLKNQEVLLELFSHKDHRDDISKILDQNKINKLRVVYCNTYAIFFMNEERVLHTFFINKVGGKFKIKSFES